MGTRVNTLRIVLYSVNDLDSGERGSGVALQLLAKGVFEMCPL